MFFAGSRYVTQWLNLGVPVETIDIYIEGNPINAASFFILIAIGLIVLFNRRVNWGDIFVRNKWVWIFFLFGLISLLWSDYPFVSFKRLIKTLGNVIMALIILTEDDPYEAIGVIFRRLAFIMLPLSILFIKYYPYIGRQYHHISGIAMYTGVATQKNGLGQICLITGIYFSWIMLMNKLQAKRLHLSIYIIILPMIIWLLHMANSATSFACMVVGIFLFIACRQPALAHAPRRILVIGIVCIVVFAVLELFFDITGTVINLLGRDETFTTRTQKWEVFLAMVRDPILGFGWEGFWLGERQQILYEKVGLMKNAHNGYLEVYLNLGFIGLFILMCCILSGFKKVSRHLIIDYPAAMLRLCFIVVIALYNWTEATFYGINNMWLMLFFAIIEISGKQRIIPNNSRYGHKRSG